MSDHGKPIDTLPTKNASELNLLDTLLGVEAGGDPAGFQTPLGELAESSDFLDALTAGLISRIIGPDAAGISPFYESGSFTPELRSSAGAVPGVNYGARSGAYTRIGSFVMFTLDMTINSISSPPASQAQITGFPIERAGVPAPYVPHVENIPVGGLGVPILDWVSATNLRLIHLNTNAGPSSIPVSSFGASARIKVAGVYQA